MDGLDKLGWGNVGLTESGRYWVHVVVAAAVACYTCRTVWRELDCFIRIRIECSETGRLSSHVGKNVILVTQIPTSWRSVPRLRELFEAFPGGVCRVYINRETVSMTGGTDDPTGEEADTDTWACFSTLALLGRQVWRARHESMDVDRSFFHKSTDSPSIGSGSTD
ncbi:hypothetical protein LTS18_004488 [Coniosporium uncinatum]|uniref:Uncharacterized protein n=1 Tax=Coniosporium uncinatum TaxID=93489 RepID=A0ACC3DCH1_9PEZI|nr:hypothetical protein LTS18_004488 [Coniosporium uncinatum]